MTNVRFADDMFLFAKSPDEITGMLAILKQEIFQIVYCLLKLTSYKYIIKVFFVSHFRLIIVMRKLRTMKYDLR